MTRWRATSSGTAMGATAAAATSSDPSGVDDDDVAAVGGLFAGNNGVDTSAPG